LTKKRDVSPLFASQISHKYAQLNVRAVQTDLEQNHGRKVAASYIQNHAEWVSDIAAAKVPMADSEGYREAMVGTFSFYDYAGERQHSIYLAAAPEYGKSELKQRPEREIARANQHYPRSAVLGHRRRCGQQAW
jgi:hypothetical protein